MTDSSQKVLVLPPRRHAGAANNARTSHFRASYIVREVRSVRERERERERDGSDVTLVALKLAMDFAPFLAKNLHLSLAKSFALFLAKNLHLSFCPLEGR